MVGVAGKYKGCETCRRRRVKCTNETPRCSMCTSTGRHCEGYEREMVFITGTPQDRGRVASHPKRVTPPKKPKTARIKVERDTKRDSVIQLSPLGSAWDERLDLSKNGEDCSPLLTALHSGLHTLRRTEEDDDGNSFGLSLDTYQPSLIMPSLDEGGLWVTAQCLLCHRGVEGGGSAPESYCVFLFENVSPTATWSVASEAMVKGLGPSHFRSFPNHHFFVRIYRPMALSLALLTRGDTFLAGPDWLTVPWDSYPKSGLDKLFDVALSLPKIFEQSDLLLLQPATVERRFKAQELLQTCLLLDRSFHQWSQEALDPFAFWTHQSPSTEGGIPFENAYAFKDELSGLMLLYFWMSQLLFHRCIEALHAALHEPIYSTYGSVWMELPLNLQIDPERFRDGRVLADNICRGLDHVLEVTAQPDMLVAPMTVALDYYRSLEVTAQPAALETLWLQAFRARLIAKGQHVANVLQNQRWIEVATFS